MSILLSQRLQAVYRMVTLGDKVADIGSDHGQLMIALCQNGKISHGYASDNKEAPYQRLISAIAHAGIIEKITVDLADGIENLPAFINTVVLAGMGGDLIVNILLKHPKKLETIETLILAPNSHVPFVRSTLAQMGFQIVDEVMVYEKHYYEIIKAHRGIASYDDKDIAFGPILRKTKGVVFKAKYIERLQVIDRLLNAKLSLKRRDELTLEKARILAL